MLSAQTQLGRWVGEMFFGGVRIMKVHALFVTRVLVLSHQRSRHCIGIKITRIFVFVVSREEGAQQRQQQGRFDYVRASTDHKAWDRHPSPTSSREQHTIIFMNIKISLCRIVCITKKHRRRSSTYGAARTLPAVHRVPVLATRNTAHHTTPARVGHRAALLRE